MSGFTVEGAEKEADLTREDDPDFPGSEYTGRDNLEVMKHAFHYNDLLLKWIRAHAHGSAQVVDFGAGAGAFAIPLVGDGHRVVCVELDPLFRSRLKEHGLRVVTTLDALPDAGADFLYAFDVLEHIEDDVGCLKQWFRKVRPGGKILVYVPAFPILYSSMDRHIGHYRRYRLRVLRDRAIEAGFAVDEAGYVDCLGFFGSLAYKLTDRGTGVIKWRAVKLYDRYVFRLSRRLDALLGRWVGKNLLVAAHKPPNSDIENGAEQ